MRRGLLALLCGVLALGAQTARQWYDLGRNYGDLSSQAFEQLLKTAPESAYVLALLGEVKMKDHQYSAALYAYNEAAKRMPKLRGVHSALADIYVVLGKPDQARDAETAEQKLGPPDCGVEKIECAFRDGRFEDVVKAAKLRKTPEGYYWLTRAYSELSVQALSQLGHLPESKELHEVKGQILREQGQFQEAAEEWRAVLKLAPDDRRALHELAAALFFTREYKQVLPELQQFLKADVQSPDLNYFVGDSFLETEQVDQAVPYLEKAVQLDAKLLPAHASLGLCYARQGKTQEAIPHLKAALQLDNDGSLHYQLARAYQATGQPALAKAMMDKYQEIRRAATSPAPSRQ